MFEFGLIEVVFELFVFLLELLFQVFVFLFAEVAAIEL